MATVNMTAIHTALRERLTGVLTTGRAIAPGLLSSDLLPNSAFLTEISRALLKPTFSVSSNIVRRQEDTPNFTSTIALYNMQTTVRVRYKLDSQVLDAAAYDVVRAQAETDIDRITQALCDAGSMVTTFAGLPTGIVSGMLFLDGATIAEDEPQQGLYSTELTFTSILKVNPT